MNKCPVFLLMCQEHHNKKQECPSCHKESQELKLPQLGCFSTTTFAKDCSSTRFATSCQSIPWQFFSKFRRAAVLLASWELAESGMSPTLDWFSPASCWLAHMRLCMMAWQQANCVDKFVQIDRSIKADPSGHCHRHNLCHCSGLWGVLWGKKLQRWWCPLWGHQLLREWRLLLGKQFPHQWHPLWGHQLLREWRLLLGKQFLHWLRRVWGEQLVRLLWRQSFLSSWLGMSVPQWVEQALHCQAPCQSQRPSPAVLLCRLHHWRCNNCREHATSNHAS